MSDEPTEKSSPAAVSPLRKKISATVLIVLIVVLLIELRAGYAHMQSGIALQKAAPEGVFENMNSTQVEELLILGPSRTVAREVPDEVEYRYGWFSLLRPLLSRPEAAFYIVVHSGDKNVVTRYSPDAPSASEVAAAKANMELRNSEAADDSSEDDANSADSHAADGGFQGGGGLQRGPEPAMKVLDKDSDGEISENEIEGAVDALFATDKNKDGVLTADELPQGQEAAPEGRRRPELDEGSTDTPDVVKPEVSAPEGDADAKAEGSASEKTQE